MLLEIQSNYNISSLDTKTLLVGIFFIYFYFFPDLQKNKKKKNKGGRIPFLWQKWASNIYWWYRKGTQSKNILDIYC